MGLYQSACYKVEDLLVKIITKKQDQAIVREKVSSYRSQKEQVRQQRKIEIGK
jgi:hypothetical protein